MKKSYVVLGIILFLGVVLRFIHLGNYPVGFHRDEAFLGYNAYSTLQTGKDMAGKFLPLHSESFLYSPTGYSYFSIPFIWLFGLSVFSVRFASALFGSVTVLAIYFLTKELFKNVRYSLEISEVAALLLAVSPWHINLSRTATENTLAMFFISFGVYLYLLWTRKDKKYLLVFSFLSFGVTLLLYQAPRAFLPLFIPILMFLFPSIEAKKRKVASLLFILVIIIPLILILSSKDLSLRIRTVSIFASEKAPLVLIDTIRTDGVFGIAPTVARAFHNKVTVYTQEFLQNYFSHFSYQFLFTDSGFPDRYRVPLSGLLYSIELPFLFLGLYRLFLDQKRLTWFLFGWMLLVPIGSGLTFDDVPNLQRTLIILPALFIAISYGIISAYSFLNNKLVAKTMVLFLFLIFIYGFLFYLHQYYVHAQRYRPWYRHDGYRELVSKVNTLLPNYKKAIITDRESAPTIFFLFFSKYDPKPFQKQAKVSKLRDFDRISFGKYEFTQEECPLKPQNLESGKTVLHEKDVIYVNSGLCKDVEDAKESSVVRRKDDSIAFRIYTIE